MSADRTPELLEVRLLSNPGFTFVGGKEVRPPRRPDSRFDRIVGNYALRRLSGLSALSITAEDLGEFDPGEAKQSGFVGHYCGALREEVPGLTLKTHEFIEDLASAKFDLLDLVDSLRNSDRLNIRRLLAGVDDIVVDCTRHVRPRIRKEIRSHLLDALLPELAEAEGQAFPQDLDWTAAARRSYRRFMKQEGVLDVDAETRSILVLAEPTRTQRLRALWGRLHDGGDIASLERSLNLCAELPKTEFRSLEFRWAIGMANCRLTQGHLKDVRDYLEDATLLYKGISLKSDPTARVALTHLEGRLAVASFEAADTPEEQLVFLDVAEKLSSGTDEHSSYLVLLRATTLVRRAFERSDPDKFGYELGWVRGSDEQVHEWISEAESLYFELEAGSSLASEEAWPAASVKALISRCYLHHIGPACGYGRSDDIRVPLREKLRGFISTPEGARNFAAIANLTYSELIDGSREAAEWSLSRTDLPTLAKRSDSGAMSCCLFGYLFCGEQGLKEVFRGKLHEFVRNQTRLTDNLVPLVTLKLLPEPMAFHHELLKVCRFGLGTGPLRKFQEESIRFRRSL